jgi:two-component system, OmpR family, sensor kinase
MSLKPEALTSSTSEQIQASNIRQPRSLRLRLVLWYGTLLTLVLLVFAVLMWNLTTDALSQSIDSSVHAETRVVGLELSRKLTPDPPYWPSSPLTLQIGDPYREPSVVVRVIDRQGTVRYSSDSNSSVQIPLTTAMTQRVLAAQPVSDTLMVKDGRVRVEAVPVYAPSVTSRDGTAGTSSPSKPPVIGMLVVARSLDDVDATLLLLRTLLLGTGVVSLVIALLGGWVIATRVLKPLGDMATTALAIAAATAHGTRVGNLSRRVQRPRGRDEMAQVVDTFNEMLSNLEKATQAQRRFVTDASHELRAPLTTIQGNLAFLNRHIDELPPGERHMMLADAHGETLRLAQLVEELLLLARADAHADDIPTALENQGDHSNDRTSQSQLLELDRIVLQLIRQFRGRLSSEDKNVKLEVGHIEPLRVYGEEESIRRVLLILLDNAIKYTPMNEQETIGSVVVSLQRSGQEAVLCVNDTGIGIEPDDLPHIFERFYRADRARQREGTGLGLAIAQTLLEQLHGRVTVESAPGQGSTFSVWLPLAKSA